MSSENSSLVRVRGGEQLQGNRIFQTQQGCCAYELTETVGADTGPAQVHTRPSPGTEKGKWAPSHTPSQHNTPSQETLQLMPAGKGKISFL